MSGAQRNFQVYGRPTSANKPISASETSAARSQAGINWINKYRGIPEARPVITQIRMRRFRIVAKTVVVFCACKLALLSYAA